MEQTIQTGAKQRSYIGDVVSDRMQKTVLVQLERRVQHPKYLKVVRRHTICMAHDERGECRVGDKVRIVESRPLSKRKRWRVVEIVQRSRISEAEPGTEAMT